MELDVVGTGELTCWLTIMVTMPLEFTRAIMFRVVPVSTLLMVLAKAELPDT